MKTRLLLGLGVFLSFVLIPTDCAKPPRLCLAPSQAVAEIYRLLPDTSRIVPGRLSGAPYRPCAGIPPIPELPGGYCDDLPKLSSQQGLKLQRAFQQAIANELGQDENWDEPPAMDELREIPYFDGLVSPRPESRAHRLHAEGIWNLLVARKPNRAVELLERAVNISPEDHALRNDLGVATLARGSAFDAWKALSHFDALVGRGADYPDLTDDPPPLVLPTEAPPLEAPTQTPRRIVSPALEPVAKWNLQLTGLSFYAFDYFASDEGPVRTRTDSPWKLEQLKRPQLPTFYRDEFFEFVRKELKRYRRTAGTSAVNASQQPAATPALFRGIPKGAPIGTWLRAFIEEELLLQWAEAAQQSGPHAAFKARRALQGIQHLLSLRSETWAPDLRAAVAQLGTASDSKHSELAGVYHLYALACRKATNEGLSQAQADLHQAANELHSSSSPLARRARIFEIMNVRDALEEMKELAQRSETAGELSSVAYALYSVALLNTIDSELDTSAEYYERAGEAATKAGDSLLLARLYTMRASRALILEDVDIFFSSWTNALRSYRLFGNERELAGVLNIQIQNPLVHPTIATPNLALSDEQVSLARAIPDIAYKVYSCRAAALLHAKLDNESTARSLIGQALEILESKPEFQFYTLSRADLLLERSALRGRLDHNACILDLSQSLTLYKGANYQLQLARVHFERALRYRALGNSELATEDFEQAFELADQTRRNASDLSILRRASNLLEGIINAYADHVFYSLEKVADSIAIADLSRNVDIRDTACKRLKDSCASEPRPNINSLRRQLPKDSAFLITLQLPTGQQSCLLGEGIETNERFYCKEITAGLQQIINLSNLLLSDSLEKETANHLAMWLHDQLTGNLLTRHSYEHLFLSVPAGLYGIPFNLLQNRNKESWRKRFIWGFVPSISLGLAKRPQGIDKDTLLIIADPPSPNLPRLPKVTEHLGDLIKQCSPCLMREDLTEEAIIHLNHLSGISQWIYTGHGDWLAQLLNGARDQKINLTSLRDVILLACSPSNQRPEHTELHAYLNDLFKLGAERVSLSETALKDIDAANLLHTFSSRAHESARLSHSLQRANQSLTESSALVSWVTYYATIPSDTNPPSMTANLEFNNAP
ncbi:MAG: CHAT domain-containing protein [Acidobacteriota bacterium]